MSPEEIESILRLQWKSLQGHSPYHEDYYFQVCAVGQHAAAFGVAACRHAHGPELHSRDMASTPWPWPWPWLWLWLQNT